MLRLFDFTVQICGSVLCVDSPFAKEIGPFRSIQLAHHRFWVDPLPLEPKLADLHILRSVHLFSDPILSPGFLVRFCSGSSCLQYLIKLDFFKAFDCVKQVFRLSDDENGFRFEVERLDKSLRIYSSLLLHLQRIRTWTSTKAKRFTAGGSSVPTAICHSYRSTNQDVTKGSGHSNHQRHCSSQRRRKHTSSSIRRQHNIILGRQ